MPRTKLIYHYRYWCQSCNNFELFAKEEDKFICEKGHEHITTLISDIPKEKVEEQRLRFKKQRSSEFQDMYGVLTSMYGSPYGNMFGTNSPISEIKIIESDAGLEFEEQEIRRKRNELIKFRKDELANYSKIGRNNICLCGSGKKYKKCHYNEHQSWN